MRVARKVATLDLITAAFLAAMVVATAAVYDHLPDPLPTHFDLSGRANGWMSRAVGAWFVPAVGVLTAAVLRFGMYLVRGELADRLRASPVRAIACSCAALLCAVQVSMLRASLAPAHRLDNAFWVALGITWVVFGFLVPRTRRNPWFGVRTKWSLSSDENWARTHRVAGYSMTLGGIVIVIAALLGSPYAAFAALLVSVAPPIFWSWHLAKRV